MQGKTSSLFAEGGKIVFLVSLFSKLFSTRFESVSTFFDAPKVWGQNATFIKSAAMYITILLSLVESNLVLCHRMTGQQRLVNAS